MARYILRDAVNRDDDGNLTVIKGDAAEIIAYLDGPVRSDLTDADLGAGPLDDAITDIRGEDVVGAAAALRPLSITLTTDPES